MPRSKTVNPEKMWDVFLHIFIYIYIDANVVRFIYFHFAQEMGIEQGTSSDWPFVRWKHAEPGWLWAKISMMMPEKGGFTFMYGTFIGKKMGKWGSHVENRHLSWLIYRDKLGICSGERWGYKWDEVGPKVSCNIMERMCYPAGDIPVRLPDALW